MNEVVSLPLMNIAANKEVAAQEEGIVPGTTYGAITIHHYDDALQFPQEYHHEHSHPHRRKQLLLSAMVIMAMAFVVVVTRSTVSFHQAQGYINVGSGSPGPSGPWTGWKAWAVGVRSYWDQKRDEWDAKEADLKAKVRSKTRP